MGYRYAFNLLMDLQRKPVQVLHFALLDDEERTDPMVKIFPKVTKCTFHNFGASGTIQQ